MTKSDLISRFSAKYPFLSIKNIEEILNIIFNEIIEALKNDFRVELRGFGTFSNHVREGVMGRNPKTGEKVFIKRRRVPFFKSGKFLKEAVNEGVDYFKEEF